MARSTKNKQTLRSTPEVRQLNRERIRRAIQQRETFTKAEVSRWTSLSVSTCNTILNEMLADGETLHVSQEDSYVGRPASRYRYNPDHLHALVVNVTAEGGRPTISLAVANAVGEILRRGERQLDEITCSTIEAFIADQLSTDRLISGIALGIPGITLDGVIERCDVQSLVGIDIEERLREKFGLAIEVGNDMLFIATGVYHTVPHQGGDHATLLFPRDNCVGCGFVIDGKPLRGHSKSAGELFYIAEGFGVTQASQMDALDDPAAFRELAARMVLITAGTIDPEFVMLMGNGVNDADLVAIRERCEPILSTRHMPRLLADNNVADFYVSGLVRVILDQLQFQLVPR